MHSYRWWKDKTFESIVLYRLTQTFKRYSCMNILMITNVFDIIFILRIYAYIYVYVYKKEYLINCSLNKKIRFTRNRRWAFFLDENIKSQILPLEENGRMHLLDATQRGASCRRSCLRDTLYMCADSYAQNQSRPRDVLASQSRERRHASRSWRFFLRSIYRIFSIDNKNDLKHKYDELRHTYLPSFFTISIY